MRSTSPASWREPKVGELMKCTGRGDVSNPAPGRMDILRGQPSGAAGVPRCSPLFDDADRTSSHCAVQMGAIRRRPMPICDE